MKTSAQIAAELNTIQSTLHLQDPETMDYWVSKIETLLWALDWRSDCSRTADEMWWISRILRDEPPVNLHADWLYQLRLRRESVHERLALCEDNMNSLSAYAFNAGQLVELRSQATFLDDLISKSEHEGVQP